jgi:hypothetical protein
MQVVHKQQLAEWPSPKAREEKYENDCGQNIKELAKTDA